VRQHLLVGELVGVGHLYHAVQGEHGADGLGLEDGDVLKVGAPRKQPLLHAQRQPAAGPQAAELREPAGLHGVESSLRGSGEGREAGKSAATTARRRPPGGSR
jgi:hypothetical protein